MRPGLHAWRAFRRAPYLLVLAACALWLGVPGRARAQIGSARYSSIVIDARSGDVLESVNAEEPRYPASLTKMMTLYMLFEALRDHRLSLGEDVPVSLHAASMEPTKLGLLPASRITVQQALLGLITLSANDAAVALGELMGGDEDRFAQMMTLRARALGMSHTTFRNASGLPNAEQVTTAEDLAILARHLITDFPNEYRYFSTPSFVYGRRTIFNHDRMLITYPGADGLKTGYTNAAGHNLATSAVRGNVRLIGIVLGAGSNPERDAHMRYLLDQGFEREGVPVAPHPDVPLLARMPNLVSSAQAAVLPLATSWRPRSGLRAHGLVTARRVSGATAMRREASVRGVERRVARPLTLPVVYEPRGKARPERLLHAQLPRSPEQEVCSVHRRCPHRGGQLASR